MTSDAGDPARAEVPLAGGVWVHAFEEDGSEGAVFRPEGERFALSRRPRRRIVFHADGTATVADGGADDRLSGRAATWSEIDGVPVIRCADGSCLRVVTREPRRLVVCREEGGESSG